MSLPRPFWRLFIASTASNLGDGVLLAALPLLAVSLSRDPAAVAGLAVARGLPWLVFGLFAGVVVDRVDRRLLMLRMDVARVVLLGGVAFGIAIDVMTLPVLYAAVFVAGVCETLFDTAAQAVVPTLVPMAHLEEANGRLFGAQLATNEFAGPPFGGVLFVAAAALPFIFDAGTFAASALLLMTLRGSFRPAQETVSVKRSVRGDLCDGLRFLWREPAIRAFAVGAAIVNTAYTAATAVLVLFATGPLGLSEVGFGVLLGAAAVGSVAGTLVTPVVTRVLGRLRAVVVAVAVFSLSLAALGATSAPAVAGVALATFGLASEVWNVLAVSYRQAAVPDHLLGRVLAAYRFIAYGAYPIGAVIGGVLARASGIRAPFFLGAALLVGLLGYLAPALARAGFGAAGPVARVG